MGHMIDVSFVYGIFAVGTFWIFRPSSHKFSLFTIVNLIMDGILAFVIIPVLEIAGIAEYKNIAHWQYCLIEFGISLIIYIYYKWQEGISKDEFQD
ncbi:hypothetical protein [Cytobacillus purgationiresistens]|uniref:Uncharacterized protein YqhQ n=1 Tax=Cytobacillus purgationiresistens TaxID=863449 RepID=A0ABU0APC3_9BACI|nr:hypothetical protein [Cytobacillus purgationiresistens]MDQ0272880.1 uncharacterized protein YqhQ [Cytobacillus purgationiresistens]